MKRWKVLKYNGFLDVTRDLVALVTKLDSVIETMDVATRMSTPLGPGDTAHEALMSWLPCPRLRDITSLF